MPGQSETVEWILRWFDRESLELVGEESLGPISEYGVRILLDVPFDDPALDEYSVAPDHVETLSGIVSTAIDLNRYAYRVCGWGRDS